MFSNACSSLTLGLVLFVFLLHVGGGKKKEICPPGMSYGDFPPAVRGNDWSLAGERKFSQKGSTRSPIN